MRSALVFALLGGTFLSLSFAAQKEKEHGHMGIHVHSAEHEEVVNPGASNQQTLCPVMGGAINTNLFADFEGQRIYVCCKGCIATIKRNPVQYIKKLESIGQMTEAIAR